jgi:hypothetical protein
MLILSRSSGHLAHTKHNLFFWGGAGPLNRLCHFSDLQLNMCLYLITVLTILLFIIMSASFSFSIYKGTGGRRSDAGRPTPGAGGGAVVAVAATDYG